MGLVLANVFIVDLQGTNIPSVISKMKLLKRYIYDIIAFVKTDGIKKILSSLTLIWVGFSGVRFDMGVSKTR